MARSSKSPSLSYGRCEFWFTMIGFGHPIVPTLPDRWQGVSASTQWSATPSGYAFAPQSSAEDPQIDWLEYTQWTCWPNPSPPAVRTAAAPILDHYGYNQDLARGALNQVSDVMLQCDLNLRGSGCVLFRIDDATDCFQLELAYPQRDARLTHNGNLVWQSSAPGSRQPWGIEFAVCDQRVLASINGVTLLERPYQRSGTSRREICAPVAVGATGLYVQLEAPKIYRDVYYLGPGGRKDAWISKWLGPDDWFVLGDNVPVSIDSRRDGPISRDSILGSVVKLSK